jgi:hypothetical protein
MSDAAHGPLDFLAPLFLPDGSVDWPRARDWVAGMHDRLQSALGTAVWTDVHAAWLGRLAHDALRYQGVGLAEATPDDLADLLFTLLPAQRDTAPGPAAVGHEALVLFFTSGAEQAGSLPARRALHSLASEHTEARFVQAMEPPTASRAPKRRKSLPRRKKGKKKRR